MPSKEEHVTPQDIESKIHEFFASKHEDGGRKVTAQDLCTMRPETIASGKHSRTRLVEVKMLRSYLHKELPSIEDQLCIHREPTVADAPHLAMGIFAIKVMGKSEVSRLKQVEHVRQEADLLRRLSHPFLLTLYYTFQDDANLYMVTEFVQLGTLGEHIRRNQQLPNDTARFYAAQIVMAVQFLHGEGVLYRNLSPSSCWLDRHNYVKLVDFSYAKRVPLEATPARRCWTRVGEPEYMAPEMVKSKGHSKEVDWWALGVVVHEMLAGYPPFYGRHEAEIYERIADTEAVERLELPRHFDPQAKDLGKKLLQPNPAKRIGSSKNGAEDIKKHKWFRGLNWAALYNKQIEPLPLRHPNGDPLGSYKDGVPTADGVPSLSVAKTATGGPDVSNFSQERSPTSTDYPHSNEETGPLLDKATDMGLFGAWGH